MACRKQLPFAVGLEQPSGPISSSRDDSTQNPGRGFVGLWMSGDESPSADAGKSTASVPTVKRKPGEGSVRLNPRHQQMVRDKIRATHLIVRLQAFALGRKIGGKVVNMTRDQIVAAGMLLDRIVPTLKSVEIVGDPDRPLEVRAHEVTAAAAQAVADQAAGESATTYESLVFGRDITAPGSETRQ